MATKKPKGLGRGLDVLLGDQSPQISPIVTEDSPSSLPLTALKAGKYQPRNSMDEASLLELSESIKSQGVIQPILVRMIKSNQGQKKYEIIAGERRFRAAKLAGLKEIPVLIKQVEDENAAIIALIENLQREDLNPLEEAQGIKRLLDEFKLTHEQVATSIGRSRSSTTNMLRLLNLTDAVQTMLIAGDLDMGHARALLALESADQINIANEVISKSLSVRDTEKLVNNFLQGKTKDKKPQSVNADISRLETLISDHLSTTVKLKVNAKNKGTIQIAFNDLDHLNDLLEKQGMNKLLQDF